MKNIISMPKLEKFLINLIPYRKWRKIIRKEYNKIEQPLDAYGTHTGRIRDAYGTHTENFHDNKRCLVSFVTSPFTSGISTEHTVSLECKTICDIFNELGYIVDVIDWDKEMPISELSQSNYSVVVGFGRSFNICCSNPNFLTIYYGNIAALKYLNIHTIQKIIEFCKCKGPWCPDSGRYYDMDDQIVMQFAKKLIILGNDFVKSTYLTPLNKARITNLDGFFHKVYEPNLNIKDYNKTKKNFLYFGATGGLHKGIDLVIEIFKKRQDINIIICGFFKREKNLYQYYKDVFDGSYPNIIYNEFVDIKTDAFKSILDNTSAVITPSVSEAGAVATLTVMGNGGLIPIISKSTGLDVNHYGFVFDNLNCTEIENKIDEFLEMDADKLKKQSIKVLNETNNKYNYENYKKRLKIIIEETINSQKK